MTYSGHIPLKKPKKGAVKKRGNNETTSKLYW